MLRKILAVLCVTFPLAACAVSGSWSGDSMGGIVSVGRQELRSRPLTPTLPAGARLFSLSWRITLLSPPPSGLKIKLCGQHGCLWLPALSGHRQVNESFSTAGPFHFFYYVEHSGRLAPPLNVVQNQLILNYHY